MNGASTAVGPLAATRMYVPYLTLHSRDVIDSVVLMYARNGLVYAVGYCRYYLCRGAMRATC